jgi:hypothetical protein
VGRAHVSSMSVCATFTTFDVRRSTFDVRRSTFDVRRYKYEVRISVFGYRPLLFLAKLPRARMPWMRKCLDL